MVERKFKGGLAKSCSKGGGEGGGEVGEKWKILENKNPIAISLLYS